MLQSAKAIFASPLTRTVQTAMLALAEHPALRTRGITLDKNLREMKREVGCFDTVGIKVGEHGVRVSTIAFSLAFRKYSNPSEASTTMHPSTESRHWFVAAKCKGTPRRNENGSDRRRQCRFSMVDGGHVRS